MSWEIQEDAAVLRDVYGDSAKIVREYLKGERQGGEITKTAMLTINAFSKVKAADNHSFANKIAEEKLRQKIGE